MRGSFWQRLVHLGMKPDDRAIVEHFLGVARAQGFPRAQAEQVVEHYFTDVQPALAAGRIDQAAAWERVFEATPFQSETQFDAVRAEIDRVMAHGAPSSPTVEQDQQRLSEIEDVMATDLTRYWGERLDAEASDIMARHEARGGSFGSTRDAVGTDTSPDPASADYAQHAIAGGTIRKVEAMLSDRTGAGYREYWANAGLQREYADALTTVHGAGEQQGGDVASPGAPEN